jgi:excisionase family DNA binding protein
MTVYTPKEVAAQFKVIPVVVVRMIRDKKLSAVKFGGSWRITQEHLDEYLEKRTLKASKKY